jgi:hypothetical protein
MAAGGGAEGEKGNAQKMRRLEGRCSKKRELIDPSHRTRGSKKGQSKRRGCRKGRTGGES